jgi:hypothetical protein
MASSGKSDGGSTVNNDERSESFSMVIKRAQWPAPPRTAGAFLKALDGVPALSDEVLDRLDKGQADDLPPEDPWRDA